MASLVCQKQEKEMEEEKKVEELYSALKNASYAFCFNVAYDESCQWS